MPPILDPNGNDPHPATRGTLVLRSQCATSSQRCRQCGHHRRNRRHVDNAGPARALRRSPPSITAPQPGATRLPERHPKKGHPANRLLRWTTRRQRHADWAPTIRHQPSRATLPADAASCAPDPHDECGAPIASADSPTHAAPKHQSRQCPNEPDFPKVPKPRRWRRSTGRTLPIPTACMVRVSHSTPQTPRTRSSTHPTSPRFPTTHHEIAAVHSRHPGHRHRKQLRMTTRAASCPLPASPQNLTTRLGAPHRVARLLSLRTPLRRVAHLTTKPAQRRPERSVCAHMQTYQSPPPQTPNTRLEHRILSLPT